MSAYVVSDASQAPPRPERLTVDFYEEPSAFVICKKRAGGPWLFLLLWLIGWTVGCVALLAGVVKDPSLGLFAFAVPFWASWLLAASWLVWMLLGKETLYLGHDEARFVRTAVAPLASRIVPRTEIQLFRACRSHHTENDHYLWGIEMVTLGKPVRFAFRLPDREREWLVHRLNQFLATSAPDEKRHLNANEQISKSATFAGAANCDAPTPASEVLILQHTLTEAPTDSRWQFTEDFDSFSFWQKGRLKLGAMAGLLFINAFWNGIVSVFVMVLFGLMPTQKGLPGWEWWGLFVFLIPFEAMGLAMFVMLVLEMLEPFRRTSWRFERGGLVKRNCWLLYCRRRAWDVAGLIRLELRNSGGQPRVRDVTGDSAETPFELALVTSDNVDLCGIGDLTEGEARWMAGIVMNQRPLWLAKRSIR